MLFAFVALYKLSRFMHTVSVNLYSSTQSGTLFLCLYLQSCTHGDAAGSLRWHSAVLLVCTQSPQKDLHQHFGVLDEALDGYVGDRDAVSCP